MISVSWLQLNITDWYTSFFKMQNCVTKLLNCCLMEKSSVGTKAEWSLDNELWVTEVFLQIRGIQRWKTRSTPRLTFVKSSVRGRRGGGGRGRGRGGYYTEQKANTWCSPTQWGKRDMLQLLMKIWVQELRFNIENIITSYINCLKQSKKKQNARCYWTQVSMSWVNL